MLDVVWIVGAFFAGTALNILAVVRPSRVLGAILTALALAVPFALRGEPVFLRTLVAQALVVETWRVVEVLRTPERYPRRERVLRVLLIPFEYTFLERAPKRWPLRELALSTALLAIGAAIAIGASRLARPVTPYALSGWPRWLGTAVGLYVTMEGMTLQWVSLLPPFGWRHRPYQRHPIVSRTIAEFWAVRWSSVVHKWLKSNVYEPLARRRHPRLGVTAAFFVSALMHAYIVWPTAGIVPALWMLAFFVVQGAALVVEAKLRIRRRVFVIAVFVLTIPLFAEPILRAMGL